MTASLLHLASNSKTTHGKNVSSCRGLFMLFLITKLIDVHHLT